MNSPVTALRRAWWPVALIWLSALCAAHPAVAEPLAEQDALAVRSVVEAQLEAMAADDAERAFSYAAASIREQFGDADTFMRMVRAGYPMVLRPTRIAFFKPSADGGQVLQRVRMRDRAGQPWLAIYGLERQPDGGWRINGCVVRPDSDSGSI